MDKQETLSCGQKFPEILAPAGSMAAVRAAVQNGADAVYMGFGSFNARRNAQNFTAEEMAQAISYCRIRGVKTNITVNTLISDRELPALMADVEFLNKAGADALIIQDLGVARLVHRHMPEMLLHASTQMTIHSLDGALFAKKLGFSRVVLSRELTLDQIQSITANAGIETEVFVHGALCMCYSGQCYLSAVIGQRSGNRGLCAQPCRLPYCYEGKKQGYPLSLKDLSLVSYLKELTDAGVSSLKIEGRMKRPEYVAIVTKIYSSVLKQKRNPTAEELKILQNVFSRDGFTQGYLLGQKGAEMFGTKTEVPLEQVKDLYAEAARTFDEGREAPLVPVHLAFTAKKGERLFLEAVTPCETGGFTTSADAPEPEAAIHRVTTQDDVEKSLSKTGGTIFNAKAIDITLDDGLMIPASVLNNLRRQVLDAQMEARAQVPQHPVSPYEPVKTKQSTDEFRGYTVQVRTLQQITQSMLRNKPETIYASADAFLKDPTKTEQLAEQKILLCIVLPRISSDSETEELAAQLELCQKFGINRVLVSNVGQILLAERLGFTAFGDFGLNVFNSESMLAFSEQQVTRQTLSFELKLPQIRDMQKPVDTELIVYGRLPLMVFENCVIHGKNGACSCKQGLTALTDRMGKRFPLLPEPGCRNTLLNSQPLYFGEKAEDYKTVGVSYGRLLFTTESPAECDKIYQAHCDGSILSFDEGVTRGLYYRGVE